MSNTHVDEMEMMVMGARDQLLAALGSGWRVSRAGSGWKARNGMLSVTLKFHPEDERGAWRCRLRDSFPRRTVMERFGASPDAAVAEIAAHTNQVRGLIDGWLGGLTPNASKSWVGYRLWSAVKPNP